MINKEKIVMEKMLIKTWLIRITGKKEIVAQLVLRKNKKTKIFSEINSEINKEKKELFFYLIIMLY